MTAKFLYPKNADLTLEVDTGNFISFWFDKGIALAFGFDNTHIRYDTKEELIREAMDLYIEEGADLTSGNLPIINNLRDITDSIYDTLMKNTDSWRSHVEFPTMYVTNTAVSAGDGLIRFELEGKRFLITVMEV